MSGNPGGALGRVGCGVMVVGFYLHLNPLYRLGVALANRAASTRL